MRRSIAVVVTAMTTFIIMGPGTAHARPFGIKSLACDSGSKRIFCTVEMTTPGGRDPLQIRWVVDNVARPIADDRTLLDICCREGTLADVSVIITDADGDSASANVQVLCRKEHP